MNQRSNCQHSLDHRENKGMPEKKKKKSASLTMQKALIVCMTTNWRILKEIKEPDHLTCLLRNLCVGQEQYFYEIVNSIKVFSYTIKRERFAVK